METVPGDGRDYSYKVVIESIERNRTSNVYFNRTEYFMVSTKSSTLGLRESRALEREGEVRIDTQTAKKLEP